MLTCEKNFNSIHFILEKKSLGNKLICLFQSDLLCLFTMKYGNVFINVYVIK